MLSRRKAYIHRPSRAELLVYAIARSWRIRVHNIHNRDAVNIDAEDVPSVNMRRAVYHNSLSRVCALNTHLARVPPTPLLYPVVHS